MPDLLIRIKKKTDGSAALSCVRADGSTTWQRQDGQQGRFFPLHDLTHYAVESVLGFHNAFFGLLASGWDISDFEKKEMRTRMPGEALLAELIVGFFDLEPRHRPARPLGDPKRECCGIAVEVGQVEGGVARHFRILIGHGQHRRSRTT